MEPNEVKELIQEKKEKKLSFFNRIVVFLGQTFKRKRRLPERVSKFEEFVKAVSPKDPIYETVKTVASLCDKAIVIAKEKLLIESKLQVLGAEIQEIAYYENLTNEDIEHLRDLLDRYMSLSKDRTAMRYQIVGFDKTLEKMGALEEDAKFILANVQDAERKQRYFKHDLMHINGERIALSYERENLLNAKNFIHKFSFALVVLFGLASIGMTLFGIITNADIFVPLLILCIMLFIIVPGMHYMRDRLVAELRLNLRKHRRAVELFNKKSVVYAHYTNFLKFVYKKYNVTNSEKLMQNIKDYSHYKHILARFDTIGNTLRSTEELIDFFIRQHGIHYMGGTIESFAKTVSIEDKQRYFWELKKEQKRLEDLNKNLEEQHNAIWNDLVLLNEEDKKSKVIDFIIQRYIEEVSLLVKTVRFDEPNLTPTEEETAQEQAQEQSQKAPSQDFRNLDFDVTRG
ncbi:MAG: hypothetical protein FWG63_02015 [Defluviitaleaceae bacterium]|nr:hypothetical protein [Defluviitaleaceae bacterium]